MTSRYLVQEEISHIYKTAMNLGLADKISALRSGMRQDFISTIPKENSTSAQLLQDLNTLNMTPLLIDNSQPIITWLENAITLTSAYKEKKVFEKALQILEKDVVDLYEKQNSPLKITNQSNWQDPIEYSGVAITLWILSSTLLLLVICYNLIVLIYKT